MKGLSILKKLSPRQKEVMDYITEHVSQKNYPPSVREICRAMGLRSSSTAHAHLKALEKKGYIRRDPTKPRAIEILDPVANTKISFQDKARLVPLLGQVTAGIPVLAEENIENYLALPEEIIKNGTVFLLRVKGPSMKDAGILDGDLVIVKQQPVAENGEIVVALLGEEATVKRFYRETGYIRLKPENPDYAPILSQDVRVLGKVIGLIRLLE
ncbi:MAG: transcriptional repressor LexA [Firmicutes bacterium]|nr:transcriptional repressor LexA [Bacillota bacterium]